MAKRTTTFFHEHPWMTFFLGMGVLETIRVAVRGWEPDPLATAKPASTPVLPSTSPAEVQSAISGLMGLYR